MTEHEALVYSIWTIALVVACFMGYQAGRHR